MEPLNFGPARQLVQCFTLPSFKRKEQRRNLSALIQKTKRIQSSKTKTNYPYLRLLCLSNYLKIHIPKKP
jgi:hypothetical protein